MDQSAAAASKWLIMKSLRVEPVVLVYVAVILSRMTALQLLLQDKLCQQRYNMSDEYCLRLSDAPSTPTKNAILADVSSYTSSREVFSLLPNIVIGLFAGAWCDRFKNGRRYCLFATLTGQILETLSLLLNAVYYRWDFRFIMLTGIPAALAGNTLFTVIFSYLSAHGAPEHRAFRFLLVDVFMSIGGITGFYMGGAMLSYTSPLWRTGLRNYCDVLLVGSGATLLSLLWSYFRIFEQEAADQTLLLPGEDLNEEGDGLASCPTPRTRLWPLIRSVFDWGHIGDVWVTMARQRTGKDRLIFHSLLVSVFLVSLPTFGALFTLFPLTEKLYKWDYQRFNYFQSLNQIVRPVATGAYMAVFVKSLALQDLEISVIGIVSNFAGFTSIASITSPTGYYLQMITGCVGTTAASGIRAFLTKHIPPDETSKVLCIMLTMEMIQPFIGSYFMSSIFRATIDTYPTLLFHAGAALLIVALIILCSIDVLVRKRVSWQISDRLVTET